MCNKVFGDLTYLVLIQGAYNSFTDPSQWGAWLTAISFNLIFNSGDIVYKALTLKSAYDQRNWLMTGTYIGKVSADVFFKAPFMSGWNYKNSDILSSKWGVAPSLFEGIDALSIYWGLGPILGS